MRINTESKNNGVILHLDGKVIGDGVPQLKQTIDSSIDSGANWIVLDLAEVMLMDSSALGTVIAAFLKLREKNGKLVLLNARENIHEVLSITKLNELFETYDDINVALESVEPADSAKT